MTCNKLHATQLSCSKLIQGWHALQSMQKTAYKTSIFLYQFCELTRLWKKIGLSLI